MGIESLKQRFPISFYINETNKQRPPGSFAALLRPMISSTPTDNVLNVFSPVGSSNATGTNDSATNYNDNNRHVNTPTAMSSAYNRRNLPGVDSTTSSGYKYTNSASSSSSSAGKSFMGSEEKSVPGSRLPPPSAAGNTATTSRSAFLSALRAQTQSSNQVTPVARRTAYDNSNLSVNSNSNSNHSSTSSIGGLSSAKETPSMTPGNNLSYSPMSRRRLSARMSTNGDLLSNERSGTTPQSNLAAHAYTLSSETLGGNNNELMEAPSTSASTKNIDGGNDRRLSEFRSQMLAQKLESERQQREKEEEAAARKRYQSPMFERLDSLPSQITSTVISSLQDRETSQSNPLQVNASQNQSGMDLKLLEGVLNAALTGLTTTLRNDLQNLHVEIIKQSLAQQATLKNLLETHLPLTGQLMEALEAARDENERLKLRMEEMNRHYRK